MLRLAIEHDREISRNIKKHDPGIYNNLHEYTQAQGKDAPLDVQHRGAS